MLGVGSRSFFVNFVISGRQPDLIQRVAVQRIIIDTADDIRIFEIGNVSADAVNPRKQRKFFAKILRQV